uniref:WASH complex subunit 3 n=1 Tax=Cuerna arida TaxID=1464854 RepID=A0A1B6H0H8_9HEMI
MLENLSSITSGVDLTQVPPIHQKRLLTFVNHFIITTVSFLNKFAQTCESKLLLCDQKMQKLEAELCILEAKLNSIPGLESVGAQQDASAVVAPTVEGSELPTAVLSTSIPGTTDEQVVENQSAESESATPPAAKDPELARFFKMVQFGVPVPAVKLKMQQEGFDPELLNS